MMRRALAAALTLAATAALGGAPEAGLTKPKSVVVRGQVTDTDGNGVAGVPVRVLATRRVAKFLTVESRPAEAELISTLTGPQGFYEMEVPKRRDFDFYFLRFYDPVRFDAVRFAIPADVEITGGIAKRRPVVADMTLESSAEWDAVQRLVNLYGAESARGKIVRQLGVPDRTERGMVAGVERETWWFESVGVAYVIEDGRVVEKKTFEKDDGSGSLARQ